MRDQFESRFKQLIEGGTIEVLASQAVTTQLRAGYPTKKTETYFRWVGKGKDVVGGELRWTSMELGKGAPFDAAKMCTRLLYTEIATPRGPLRWFDDHPDAGDGRGMVSDGQRLFAYDNGDLLPCSLVLETYFALQRATPGLISVLLMVDPSLCAFADAGAAKLFLKQRKDAAKQALKFAAKLFGDVDLTHTEAFLTGVVNERFATFAQPPGVGLRAKA